MLLVPSKEIFFETDLDTGTFLQRLSEQTEPRKRGFKLRVQKNFEGEVSENGSFDLTYGRGMQVKGTVASRENGALVRMRIGLPRGSLAFALAFAWGTFSIGLTGIAMLTFSHPNPTIFGFIKAVFIVAIPGLISYGLMLINLWQCVDFTKEYFNDHFRR